MRLRTAAILWAALAFVGCNGEEGDGGGGGGGGLPTVGSWGSVGGQVSAGTAESEDPTMLIVGGVPTVGYRDASFKTIVSEWNEAGSAWDGSTYDPTSGQTNSSIYGTPAFCTDGTDLFVAYSHAGGGSDAAFYDRIYLLRRATTTSWTAWNGGNEVSIEWNVSDGGVDAWEPDVAIGPAGDPVVAWVEADATGGPDDGLWVATVSSLSCARSSILSRDNGGGSYATDVRTVGIAANATTTYVAQWESDDDDQDLTQLYVSSYAGSSFTSLGGAISQDYDYNNLCVPSLAADATAVYIAYTEANDSDNTKHVYVKRWSGSAWELLGGGPLSAFSAVDHYDSTNPDVLLIDGTPYVAWAEEDQYDGPFVFVARWTESAWEVVGDKINVDISRAALDPSLAWAAGESRIYVAFEEMVSGWPQIFVRRATLTP
jgi:hypothetical protein